MEGRSMEYYLGFVVGFLVTLAMIVVIVKAFRKQTGEIGGKKEYDERQQMARGKAYKAAFWFLAAYVFADALITESFGPWAEDFVDAIIGLLAAITVFVVICIRQDAYFPLNAKYSYYLKLFTFILVLNLLVAALNLFVGDKPIENGMLNYHAVNLLLVLMYAVVIPFMVAQHRKESAEEDEE